jgi:G:T/U-mismatch repair DNA glycosylase
MKDNYNIKINPPKLSSEQIEKHMNFDALLEQMNKGLSAEKALPNKRFRIIVAISSLAVAASVALILVYSGLFSSEKELVQFALSTPFEKIDIGFNNYQVDAEKGDTLRHNSGSVVVVPAAAFIDSKGRPVTGKVDIQYREMNEAADKFIAGVPQKVENTVLQSAGTIQIQGFKDGKAVYINPDKALQIELKTTVATALSLSELKSYAFSSKEKDWKESGTVQTVVISEQAAETQTVTEPMSMDKILENIQRKYPLPVRPIEPVKGSPANMMVLGFDVNTKEYPEFAQYENVDWMALKSVVDPLPDDGWSKMKVNKIADLKYEIVMIPNEASRKKGRSEVRFEAYPLIPYNQKTMRDYEKAMNEYNSALAKREEQLSRELASLDINDTPKAEKVSKKVKFSTQTIISRFNIREFGLWAAAKPFDLKTLPMVNTSFKDASGKNIEVAEIFVSDTEKQLYFSSSDKSKLNLDSESEYKKVWILSNGQLYVANPTKRENNKVEFELQPALQPKNENDIRNVLI